VRECEENIKRYGGSMTQRWLAAVLCIARRGLGRSKGMQMYADLAAVVAAIDTEQAESKKWSQNNF
jgi:hypothetical protein